MTACFGLKKASRGKIGCGFVPQRHSIRIHIDFISKHHVLNQSTHAPGNRKSQNLGLLKWIISGLRVLALTKRHVGSGNEIVHRARALRNKTNNDRDDGHCCSFAWISRPWTFGTPTFLFRNRFYLHRVSHCPKMNKNWAWEDFCPRDIESCHLATASAWNYGR